MRFRDNASSPIESPHNRRNARRTQAASADPPPSPAATGMRFSNRISAPSPGSAFSARRTPARWAMLASPSGTERAKGALRSNRSETPREQRRTETRSPDMANATRLSTACKPSGRRPVTCRQRLIFARAIARISARLVRGDSKAFPCLPLRPLADVLLRIERQCPLPLVACLRAVTQRPEHVAEMVIDFGDTGFELQCLLQEVQCALVVPDAVKRPSDGVENVRILGSTRERRFQQLQSTLRCNPLSIQ